MIFLGLRAQDRDRVGYNKNNLKMKVMWGCCERKIPCHNIGEHINSCIPGGEKGDAKSG